MAAKRGKDFKIYLNVDDPYDASPTWEEMTNVRDVTRNGSTARADASIRGSVVRLELPTLIEFSLDFQMIYDPDDAHFDSLEEAFWATDIADKYREFAALDGSIQVVGTKGIRFMGMVADFTGNEPLEDMGTNDVTIIPAYYTGNLPRRVEVTSPGVLADVA